ncbi:hypothetical protein [Arthrobacter sp. A2-55]|uniref:hypothetical protein n=1 Tax=Arthrobacter sp. A2-55 TaxID=2897337 RepID=UPI0021CDD3C1|nr:hypothetical protein [Arthrobacter sp. A2-55]MCU6481913.1 hypothetical protein [Arthrobacter sp. A2-55]
MTRVAKYRGRKIVINEMAELIGSKACGLWLSTDETEFVFHAPTKSALHRQQCILHELAHMVLRHDETVVSVEYAPTLFPDLSGERVRSALARSDFLREEEITAELLADLFAKAIHDSSQEPQNFEGVFG